MAIASGLGAAFGIVPETTYATLPGSPTWRWHDTKDKLPDLKRVKNVVQGGGLAAGRLLDPASRRLPTSFGGTIGSIPTEVLNNKMGLLLNMLFGGTVTPVQQASSTAYLQTYTLVDNVGKMFSAQVQVPQTDGTLKPFTGRGGKITSGEFSCEGPDGALMVDFAADFQQVLDSDAAGAPSYATGQWPFHFGHLAVKIGAYGSEAAATGVRKVSCKIERPQAIDRIYAGASGLKAEPLMNDNPKITGSLDVDFTDKTQFADRFASDANASLILSWTASTAIASTYFPGFQLTLPATFFDDGTPTVDDRGVPKTSYPFTVQYDEVHNPVTCLYMTTDTAL